MASSKQLQFLCTFVLITLFLNVEFSTAKLASKAKNQQPTKNRTPSITIQLTKPTSAESAALLLLKCKKGGHDRSPCDISEPAEPGSGLAVCQRACQNAGLGGGTLDGDKCYCDCVPNPCNSSDGIRCGAEGQGTNCNQVCQIFGLGEHGHCSSAHRCVCTECPFCPCETPE